MKRLTLLLALFWTACVLMDAQTLAVRGIHLAAPKPDDMDLALRFIKEALAREGVNTLVLEINYHYKFVSHPEVIDGDALTREQLGQLAEACRASGVKLIPMVNMLGHQSWAGTTFGLLRAHPEFDETPGMYPGNKDIYCRSYCPRHPEVHKAIFDLIDELMEVTGATDFHAGMDEVFLLGEDSCPRCKGANKAELFAGEVKALRDHLAGKNRTLWIWGDRMIDGNVTGIGKWEASMNGTAPSMQTVPKDVIIADWHYESAHPTAALFALNGYRVVSSPWRKPGVALRQLDQMRMAKAAAPKDAGERYLGMLQTTWAGFGPFVKAYFGEGEVRLNVAEAVLCFKELFRELRKTQ